MRKTILIVALLATSFLYGQDTRLRFNSDMTVIVIETFDTQRSSYVPTTKIVNNTIYERTGHSYYPTHYIDNTTTGTYIRPVVREHVSVITPSTNTNTNTSTNTNFDQQLRKVVTGYLDNLTPLVVQ